MIFTGACLLADLALPLKVAKQSGYVFRSAPAILPFLEHPKTGSTSRFCAELARRLECYVVAGFPERLEAGNEPGVGSSAGTADVADVGANSAAVYGPDGECVSFCSRGP
jgi:protein N-terminal amidase